MNSHYNGLRPIPYGGDVGYFITPEINALLVTTTSRVMTALATVQASKVAWHFAVADDVEFGGNYSYDDAFHSRFC